MTAALVDHTVVATGLLAMTLVTALGIFIVANCGARTNQRVVLAIGVCCATLVLEVGLAALLAGGLSSESSAHSRLEADVARGPRIEDVPGWVCLVWGAVILAALGLVRLRRTRRPDPSS